MRQSRQEILVNHGYVEPLAPGSNPFDIDLDTLNGIANRMASTGYTSTNSSLSFTDIGTTTEEWAKASLFRGGDQRSEAAYKRAIVAGDQVIGPYRVKEGRGLALWQDLRAGLRRKHGDISWGILGGRGQIGSRIIEQLKDPMIAARSGLSVVPDFIVGKNGLSLEGEEKALPFGMKTLLPEVDLLFVAMPGYGGADSLTDVHIVRQFARRGIVVSAEKASFSEHFVEYKELSDDFRLFGYNATVGGGTRLMDKLASDCVDVKNIHELHLALNGTLSFFMGQVANGVAPGVAIDQAIDLHYAEPGAEGVEDVLRAEATSDVPRKLAIVMNKLLFTDQTAVHPLDFDFDVNDKDIRTAIREAADRRFVVSLYNLDKMQGSVEEKSESVIGGFTQMYDGWLVVSGFQRLSHNSLLKPFDRAGAIAGYSAGLGPHSQDGTPYMIGDGAGRKQTANTMLDDAQRLIAAQRAK